MWLISYSYCYPCKTFPKNNTGRTGKWINMAFKVWLRYGCSQPSSCIFVFYIFFVWRIHQNSLSLTCSSIVLVQKCTVSITWILNFLDYWISPYGKKGYNMVPVSWNTITVLLFSSRHDHVYQWWTVTNNLFQTSYIMHTICNALLLLVECSERQAVGGNVDT